MWRQMIAGVRYVRRRPRVQALLGIAAVVSLCGLPFLIFLPVFARDVLNLDARGLARLWAATGVGALVSALLMAFVLSKLVRDKMRGRAMSMYALAFIGMPPIGGLLIGSLADLIGDRFGLHGVQLALAAGGSVIVLFAAGVALAVPRVKALD